MNLQHLQAFLWLRWRLRINVLRRGGIANTIILSLLAAGAFLGAFGLFVTFLFVGLLAFAKATPAVLMYTCDILVAVFLFCWILGLLIDLQRSEPMSLNKFLHLPVSVAGVFLINYLSSFFSVSLLFFVPAMLGLGLGLLFSKGPALLLYFPLLAAFLLMVTALTYQFQGWLGSLMMNPRRRRTIVVLLLGGFILMAQVPNLTINVIQPWGIREQKELTERKEKAEAELERSLKEHSVEAAEYQRQRKEIEEDYKTQTKTIRETTNQQVAQSAGLLNLVLPPGWLPLGMKAASEGRIWPALLGTLGLALIGGASLYRSYKTTVRLFQGQFRSKKKHAVQPAVAVRTPKTGASLLEKRIPGLSEHASAIALATFRSFLRAPESKIMLLSPLILIIVFGSILVGRHVPLPEGVRPLLPFGAMSMIMLTMIQFGGNQFGFDRSGFRVFVLCASPRRDVLLGKNLALAPLALAFAFLAVILLQVIYPTSLDYFLATLPEMLSVFLLFAMLANWLSILAPMPMAQGSFKPTHYKGLPLLLHTAFVLVFPMVLVPALLPLGIALTLRTLEWVDWTPVCLVLSLAECVGMIYLYRLVLTWQGDLLQAREQRILEVVTSKSE